MSIEPVVGDKIKFTYNNSIPSVEINGIVVKTGKYDVVMLIDKIHENHYGWENVLKHLENPTLKLKMPTTKYNRGWCISKHDIIKIYD